MNQKYLFGTLMAAWAAPVAAQDVPAATSPAAQAKADASADIIVTARRRDETLISVPVAVSVVTGADLTRRGITNLDTLAQAVPQLIISDVGNNAQGGVVVIRGIGVGESNPFADQAVSFNVDGVQVSRANIRRMAEVDLKQVEVLKGPQALFFGKNSPGGIVVLHTADPGDHFEAGANTSYEFVGDEIRSEGYVSGPLSDTFGVRVAAYGSHLSGYFHNVIPPTALNGPATPRLPGNTEYGGRVTLKFNPSNAFDAKLKISYGHVRSTGPDSTIQSVNCPFGASQLSTADDCKANNTLIRADLGPALAALAPDLAAESYLKQRQLLIGYEMNYHLIPRRAEADSRLGFPSC